MEGIGIAQGALRIAESVDQPFSLIWGWVTVGHVNLLRGELQKAISGLQRTLELIRVWNIPLAFPWAAASLGYTLMLTGNLSEGMQFLEDGLKRAVIIPHMIGYSQWLTWLGETHLAAGRTEEAARVAEQSLSRCRNYGERGNMACALRLLGEIASYPDRPDVEKAGNYFRQAMGLAEELGMRPLIARCHLDLGKLYRRAGKPEQGHNHVSSAMTMYREMDMPFWLEKAKAEMREM